jgi:molybdopterin-containing oxidoreductase family membrane subunit
MASSLRPYRFGIFSHLDTCLGAIKQLPGDGFKEIEVYSPTPHHEIAHVLRRKPSPVRVFTLVGGLIGLIAGWAMTIGSTMIYPIIVGGKPIISIPPFGVVAYITTILFGTIATFIGFLVNARVPQVKIVQGYDERLSSDHFGVLAYCLPEDVMKLEKLLKKLGAVAVTGSQGL